MATGVRGHSGPVAADPTVTPAPARSPGEEHPLASHAMTPVQLARSQVQHQVDQRATDQVPDRRQRFPGQSGSPTRNGHQLERGGGEARSHRPLPHILGQPIRSDQTVQHGLRGIALAQHLGQLILAQLGGEGGERRPSAGPTAELFKGGDAVPAGGGTRVGELNREWVSNRRHLSETT